MYWGRPRNHGGGLLDVSRMLGLVLVEREEGATSGHQKDTPYPGPHTCVVLWAPSADDIKSPEPVNATIFVKRVYADVMKLLRQGDNPGLSRRTLDNSRSILVRKEKRRKKRCRGDSPVETGRDRKGPWAPGAGKTTFLLFKATNFVVICSLSIL